MGKSKGLVERKRKKPLKLLEVHTSKRLIRRLRRALHFLYLYHTLHAVAAQDVDLARGPHALAALGANELAGGAGPLAARGIGSRLGGPSGSGADDGRYCVALHNTEDVVAKLARELVSTPPHASLSAVKTWPQGQLRAKKCPRPFTEPGIFFCGLARR